jgi:hypothetical protein
MLMNPANWKYRRRYLVFVTLFTMGMMVAALVWRPEASVSRVVIEMGFVAIVSFVGSYVFGAVWDQNNQRKHDAQRTVNNDPT